MYGDWDAFTDNRRSQFRGFLYPGISGNAVVTKRSLFDTIGQWSTAVAAADWDLQLRLVKAQTERGRPKQCMIAADVFVHHFIRATARAKPAQRGCVHPLEGITACYGKKDLAYLNRPAVSVIIAVYERPDFLEKVFAGLHNQTLDDFEVVVADDGSGPAIAALIAGWQGRFCYPIAHVWQEHRDFRKTIIANRAAVQSRSDYLCFIDGDAIPHHRFLHTHMAARRIHTVLSGRRVMLDKDLTEKLTLDDVRNGRLERASFWLKHAEAGSRKHGMRASIVSALENGWRGARRKNYCILGSNFSVFKGDFYRVNGYEESITGRGLEDNNLSNRFTLAGMRVRTVARSAIQYHLHHESNSIPHHKDVIARYGQPETFWAEKGIAHPSVQ
jgi:glycosyltransferase involved in cell wall biosynthesis